MKNEMTARSAALSKRHAEDVLHSFNRRGIVSSFGYVTIPGHGKTPKVYYLKRKGFELLRNESGIPKELIGGYSEAHQEATWSPQMYHRLRLLDVLIALEVQSGSARNCTWSKPLSNTSG